MTTTHADAAPTRSLVGRYFRQLGIDTQYVLIGFPIGMVTLVVALTGFALGLGLAVLWVGLPVLVGTLMLSRGFAVTERARIGPVIGRPMPHPHYKRVRGEGLHRRIFGPLSDGQGWLDLLHAIFRFIPNTLGFCFVVTWWAVAIAGLTIPLWDWALPHTENNYELHELLGFQDTMSTRILFNFSIGVFFAGTLYWVVRGAALIEAYFAKGLLVSVAELREQIAVAEEARDVAQRQKAAAVSAEAVALRKLERDIHDGPQQRLVRLAMDLGRAEQQFTADPDRARAIVAEALTQTRETLDELRALSRGIAPPILVDRGLRAALTALASRCTIPVDLEAPPMDRLEPGVESTAYFVVAEALTNVAKHSYANEVQVKIERIAAVLFVTVRDDGVGGASLAKGHGLAGLNDRVEAAGGVLELESAEGKGTQLTAALPI